MQQFIPQNTNPYLSRPTSYQPFHAHVTIQNQFSAPPGFGPTENNALNPSDIGTALTNVNLNNTDPQWYMDSAASSHITSDSGKLTTPCFLPISPIFVGNGQRLPISGSGNDFYQVPNKTYQLNQIIHSPQVIK